MKYSYNEFQRLVSLPLKDKIAFSEQLILYALKESKTGHSVSCSWGKDSVVMLHLIQKFCKKSKVIFADTGVEYPETYQYRDKMLASVFSGIEYYETKPIKTFWECVKEYGYPHNRQTAEQDKKGEKSKRSPACCLYLKEKPMQIKEKELGVDTVFIGLQATESMNRRLLFLRLGGYYFNKKEKRFMCLPLIIWNNADIWAYAKQENLPMCDIYKQAKRNGCMPCTGFLNWKTVMAKYNPKLYEKVLREKEGQTVIAPCTYLQSPENLKGKGKGD